MNPTVYTIGHSNNTLEAFIALLQRHGIGTLLDVRSSPYSRMYPHFSKEALTRAMSEAGVHYVFLGKELGARTPDSSCYDHGKVNYARLAATASFKRGIEQVLAVSAEQPAALMCAEKDPLTCHRTILVARALEALEVPVEHIHQDGHVESQQDAMTRLLGLLKMPAEDLFMSRDELVARACELQGGKIAYVDEERLNAATG